MGMQRRECNAGDATTGDETAFPSKIFLAKLRQNSGTIEAKFGQI